MVLHVCCVVSGGIPVFYRSSGEETTPSFSELAPLNGIQVFGKVHSVLFKSTEGKDFNISWKSFTEKLSLILISKQVVCNDGEPVLNCIFDAMVLTVGLDELTNIKRVDRLKKEIRPAYPLIDDILQSVDEYPEIPYHVRLLSMVEVIPSVNQNIFQEKLDEWSESISSLFCCLTIEDKIIVATTAWWNLTTVEKSLLSILLTINNNCTSVDIPVFLPVKSPKLAFRLVSCCLMNSVWVNALCGPKPNITDFEESAALCWSTVAEYLNEVPLAVPQIIPENLNIQNGIIGLLLINHQVGNYILLGSVMDNKFHFDVLRIFYYRNIRELLKENGKNDEHKIRETFWYSENHKLYGVLNDPYILCLMTSSVVPTPSVRLISKDILALMTNNKILIH